MFVSNTALSHCANTHCLLAKGETRTYRGYMKPTVSGALLWRFTWQNTVDSTWADGALSRADLPGGRLRIRRAGVCVCGRDKAILSAHPVTFNGVDVGPNQVIQTDPVWLNVPRDGYVMFNWCLEALEADCVLPATPDSRAPVYTALGEEEERAPLAHFRPLEEAKEEPGALPWLWAAERKNVRQMAFIGDSITQGCQTRLDHYEQWAARIIRGLPENVAGLNVGLGYAQARDAARNGAWLKKLAGCDAVNLCLGTNDILHGDRAPGRAERLTESLARAVSALRENNPRVRVVLFTLPPFSLREENEQVRRAVNARIRAHRLGADAIFDMELLGVPGSEGKARFGPHPNGEGGLAVAQSYLEEFLPSHLPLLLP